MLERASSGEDTNSNSKTRGPKVCDSLKEGKYQQVHCPF